VPGEGGEGADVRVCVCMGGASAYHCAKTATGGDRVGAGGGQSGGGKGCGGIGNGGRGLGVDARKRVDVVVCSEGSERQRVVCVGAEPEWVGA
jgi:hypothetical protein